MRRLDGITDLMDMRLGELWELVGGSRIIRSGAPPPSFPDSTTGSRKRGCLISSLTGDEEGKEIQEKLPTLGI